MRTALLLLLTTLLATAQQPVFLGISPTSTPGSWLTLRGSFFADSERTWTPADFNGTALPTSLDGVTVKVSGKSAAIAYVSNRTVQLLIPADAPLGPSSLTLTNPKGASLTISITLQPFAPEWLAGPLHANGNPVSVDDPAEPGETVIAYGTGFGPTSPPVDPMTIFSGAAPLASPSAVTLTIGGAPATVAFAGLTANGLYQFNIVVPQLPEGPAYPLTATAAGRSASLPIAVAPPGPPVITGMTPNDFIWGQETTVSLRGTGLQGRNTITISDPAQLTFSATPNQGTAFPLRIAENAGPGTRTLTVTNNRGTSNAFPFTIRRGDPRITSLTPSTAWPGRVYPFRIEGIDLAAVRTVELAPAAFRAQFGLLQLDDTVPTGPYQLRVRSPWDVSPPVPLLVAPAPPTAPAIRALSQVEVRTYSPLPATELADYTGVFEFTDANGDVKSGNRVEILIEIDGEIRSTSGFIQLLPQPGTARFTCTQSTRSPRTGPFPIWVTLFDEAGNPSNALKAQIPVWYN